jgi:hypothetical protein
VWIRRKFPGSIIVIFLPFWIYTICLCPKYNILYRFIVFLQFSLEMALVDHEFWNQIVQLRNVWTMCLLEHILLFHFDFECHGLNTSLLMISKAIRTQRCCIRFWTYMFCRECFCTKYIVSCTIDMCHKYDVTFMGILFDKIVSICTFDLSIGRFLRLICSSIWDMYAIMRKEKWMQLYVDILDVLITVTLCWY